MLSIFPSELTEQGNHVLFLSYIPTLCKNSASHLMNSELRCRSSEHFCTKFLWALVMKYHSQWGGLEADWLIQFWRCQKSEIKVQVFEVISGPCASQARMICSRLLSQSVFPVLIGSINLHGILFLCVLSLHGIFLKILVTSDWDPPYPV